MAHFTCDLADLDPRDLLLMPPTARVKASTEEKSRISKVYHREEGCHVLCRLKGVNLENVQQLRDTVIHVKLPSRARQVLLDIDEKFRDTLTANVSVWFKNKCRPQMIEEYCVPSVTVHKRFGTVGKMHFSNDVAALAALKSEAHDMTVRLYGIRFLSNTFYLVWQLVEASPNSDVFGVDEPDNDLDDDHDHDDTAAANRAGHPQPQAAPSASDIRAIRKVIARVTAQVKAHLQSVQERTLKLLTDLEMQMDVVERGDVSDLERVDTWLRHIVAELKAPSQLDQLDRVDLQ